MKRLAILVLIIFVMSSLLVGCGSYYDQEALQEAWDYGYEQGYNDGYTKGWQDASVTTQPATSPQTPSKVFVGSINSNIYHYPDCKWAKKILPQNEIWFSSVADAKAHGYRACKVCRPPP